MSYKTTHISFYVNLFLKRNNILFNKKKISFNINK